MSAPRRSGPSRTGPVHPSAGLTLIELLLALAILAVAGVLVSSAFSTSLRAWQSGFASGRGDLVGRIVVERIAAQLRSVVASPARLNQQAAIAFDAKEHALRFVTLAAAGAVPMQVSYALEDAADGARLVYREYPWPDKDFFGSHQPRQEEAIPEVTGFTVAVVKRADEEPEEGSEHGAATGAILPGEWSPRDQLLPQSVTVDLTLRAEGGGEPRSYRIAVSLPTEAMP